jgi:membrane protein implicated in regulation of membrane protease activity
VTAIALQPGDAPRVERVTAVGADGRTAEGDLGEHDLAEWRRHRRASILAGISLLIALLLAFFVLPSPWGVVVVLCACVLEIVEITWGLRLARKRSTIGSHTLVGREAVVVRELDPTGQVTIDGERWKAHCATGAAVGAKVVIESITGLTLEVRVYTSVSDAEAGGAARSV